MFFPTVVVGGMSDRVLGEAHRGQYSELEIFFFEIEYLVSDSDKENNVNRGYFVTLLVFTYFLSPY